MKGIVLVAKGFSGLIIAGAIGGGMTAAGYKLKELLDKKGPTELSKTAEFEWEYFFKDKSKKICESMKGNQLRQGCDTPWANKINEENKDSELIGWWIVGKQEPVNNMLKGWKSSKRNVDHKNINSNLKLENGISGLEQDSKCKVERSGIDKVSIECKNLEDKTLNSN